MKSTIIDLNKKSKCILLLFLLLIAFPVRAIADVNCSDIFYDPMGHLNVDGGTFTDSICVGYYQQYRFSIISDHIYQVTVSPTNTSDPDLYLHHSDTVSHENFSYSSEIKNNVVETLTFTATTTGYYYTAVYGYSTASGLTTDYSISLEDITTNNYPQVTLTTETWTGSRSGFSEDHFPLSGGDVALLRQNLPALMSCLASRMVESRYLD